MINISYSWHNDYIVPKFSHMGKPDNTKYMLFPCRTIDQREFFSSLPLRGMEEYIHLFSECQNP